jgi:hypothetical protein
MRVLPSITSMESFRGLDRNASASLNGEISLQVGKLDPDLFLHVDRANGKPRFTYVRLDHQSVTAFANIIATEAMKGLPCFQVGVAVPEAHRGKGHAKSIVAAAIAELSHGLSRNQISSFYVEAVVGVDNEPSKRVAASTISAVPVGITDEVSGLLALHYVRRVTAGPVP